MASPDIMVMSRKQQNGDSGVPSVSNSHPPTSEGDELAVRQSNSLSYMHRPPTIMPNYGKKSRGSVLPKSNVSRVLLYDNITQQSMLDVRLNSIKSQSYKTHRELDMHMKSFISRRNARQKALKKLTRVPHHEDYIQFEQDQQQQFWRHQNPHLDSIGSDNSDDRHGPDGHGNQHFPEIGIRSNNVHTRLHHPSTANHLRKQISDSNRSPVNTNDNAARGDIDGEKSIKGSTESLPQISLSAPSSLVRNEKASLGKYHNLGDGKNIGYRMVKGRNGQTRIFHALPDSEFNEKQFQKHSPRGDDYTSKSRKLLPLRRGVQNRRIHQKQSKRREHYYRAHEDSYMFRDDSPMEDSEGDHFEEPLSDVRYVHLHKLLIPQDPPNEGYTELSPSFPRHYPTIDGAGVSKRRRKKKRREKREGRRAEDNVQNEDDASGSEWSDCDEDEEEKEEQQNDLAENGATLK